MPGTEPRASSAPISPDPDAGLTRRALLRGAAVALGAAALAPRRLFAREADFALRPEVVAALAKGKLVYVSPLKSDGGESRCHGEVWYFWDRDAVVIATATRGWKVRAVRAGREHARLWVGDFGPYAKAGEKIRTGPTFLARAAIDPDAGTWERLLTGYGARYPEEWGKWKPRFEAGRADGSRSVLRYTPIGD